MSMGRRSQRLVKAAEELKQEPIRVDAETEVPAAPSTRLSPADTVEAPKRKHDEIDEEPDAEAPPAKSQQTYQKHDTHWIPDGNLLLQIGKVRFKVHRSRLASESEWFQALIDQRAGHVPEKPFEDQAEIDEALEAAEVVDELDLFYLDLDGAPKAEEFAALLTAMQSGIDYVYNPPDFDTMASIYEASVYFQMRRYNEFCSSFFKSKFPDDWKSVDLHPSPHATQGVRIGSAFGLHSILRYSFYDLARSPPLPIPFLESDELVPGQATELGKLKSADLICLLNLQKQLSLAWDSVRSMTQYSCKSGTCTTFHACATTFKKVKGKYPFDPILGIKALLENEPITKGYCEDAEKEVRRRLALEQDLIWTNMKGWLGLV